MKPFPSVLETINDLAPEQIEYLFQQALFFLNHKDIYSHHQNFRYALKGMPVFVGTLFKECSTRTLCSYETAIKTLGIRHIHLSHEDLSVQKGEGLEQTLLTLKHLGMQLVVLRTPNDHELSPFKKNPPIKIINGGDGQNQHPTQALIDLFTLKQVYKNLSGLKVAIIGDIEHSRVAHSLIDLLPQFGIELILCGPEEFLPKNSNLKKTNSLKEAISQSDALYSLRVQRERHPDKISMSNESYHKNYGLTLDNIGSLNVFHPGPVNIGTELESQVLYSQAYMGHLQVQYSLYVRMALLDVMLKEFQKEKNALSS